MSKTRCVAGHCRLQQLRWPSLKRYQSPTKKALKFVAPAPAGHPSKPLGTSHPKHDVYRNSRAIAGISEAKPSLQIQHLALISQVVRPNCECLSKPTVSIRNDELCGLVNLYHPFHPRCPQIHHTRTPITQPASKLA